jgi:hypothetical protein
MWRESMTVDGHMQSGVAVPDSPIQLPDGTPVRINVLPANSAFWQNKTVEQLAQEQGVRPISDIEELAGDWPPEDSMDEFLQFLREIRK